MEQGDNSTSTVLEQRKAAWESGQLQHDLIGQLLGPQALLEIGSAIQQVGTVVNQLMRPEVIASIQSVLHQIRTVIASPEVLQGVRTALAVGKEVERILKSPLVAYLLSDHASELGKFVEGAGEATLSLKVTGDARILSHGQLELEQQIVSHLEGGEDAATLSDTQKNYLHAMLQILILICAYLATQNGVREELCFLQPKLLPSMTSNQIGKSVRAALCDSPIDQFSAYRSVKGVGVRLRSAPKMNASLVQVVLSDRALLEVLDSSNRDWLFVAVIGEEGVEGWISRKYTHPIHR